MSTYKLLEPGIAESIGGNSISFDTANTTSLFTSSSFLYTFAFVVIIVTASFRYALAGMLRMQASEEGIRKSKEEFKRVTYGLLGVLGLWLILFTVNKDMLTGDVTLKGLELKKITQTTVSVVPGTVNTPTTPGTVVPGTQTTASETTNRTRLTEVGVTINKAACVGSAADCTNVGDINPASIDLLLNLKRSCNCSVLVTGGSEGGHSANSNHGPGKEAVDISLTQELLSFLKQQGVNVGDDTTCNTKYKWGGFIFWDEEQGCDSVGGVRHFHASFTGR